jgi:hypothetical protein
MAFELTALEGTEPPPAPKASFTFGAPKAGKSLSSSMGPLVGVGQEANTAAERESFAALALVWRSTSRSSTFDLKAVFLDRVESTLSLTDTRDGI